MAAVLSVTRVCAETFSWAPSLQALGEKVHAGVPAGTGRGGFATGALGNARAVPSRVMLQPRRQQSQHRLLVFCLKQY